MPKDAARFHTQIHRFTDRARRTGSDSGRIQREERNLLDRNPTRLQAAASESRAEISARTGADRVNRRGSDLFARQDAEIERSPMAEQKRSSQSDRLRDAAGERVQDQLQKFFDHRESESKRRAIRTLIVFELLLAGVHMAIP